MLATHSIPTIFPLLRDRKLSLIALGAAVTLVSFFALGFPAWPCPFLKVTGLPCPGCGLTRALFFLIKGDLKTSLTYHAFAPLFLLGFLVVAVASVLPDRTRQVWIDKLVTLEQRSGLVLIALTGLILYWLARLVFLNSAFVQLIRG
jgi:Protein of unknown function (DUF2752)